MNESLRMFVVVGVVVVVDHHSWKALCDYFRSFVRLVVSLFALNSGETAEFIRQQ